MSENNPTHVGIDSVCITVGNDHHMRTVASSSGSGGSVFVGQAHTGGVVQFSGSVHQLRTLAAAIIEGADDIAAQIAQRAEQEAAAEAASDQQARALVHYGAMAAAASEGPF